MGLTRLRASQISDIDYKQAVRAVTTTNITLSGGAPATVDGVVLSLNNRILVTAQSTGSQNGIYTVTTTGSGSDGTWERSTDTNATGELLAGTIVMVTEGTTYADTQWKLTTNDPIVIGTTPLTFVINILSQIGGGNTQIQYNNAGTMGASPNLTWNGTTLYANGVISATGDISAAGNVSALNFNSTSADLAEKYTSDQAYPPGTVVVFGGSKEVTINNHDHDTAVAGVVSTDPSYLMNSAQQGEFVLPIALTGRVPCRVQGPVNKGTVLVSGSSPGTATAIVVSKFKPGCVLGKSLEIISTSDIKTIEIAVGRL
jgi:hypothetical protein